MIYLVQDLGRRFLDNHVEMRRHRLLTRSSPILCVADQLMAIQSSGDASGAPLT